jgi:hypothetical protein
MAVNDQLITDKYAIYNGDCIEAMESLPEGKTHLSIYSPPFGGLYHYSSSERDLSNCSDYNQFFDHYGFVVRGLHRITMPGRISAVHVSEVPSGNSGNDHLRDFPGDCIRLHEQNGWHYIGRHTIWKEPLWVRNRTLQKNLAHKTIVNDSTLAGVASPDWILLFRRSGQNPVPVAHPTGLLHYAGSKKMPAELLRYRGYKGKQTGNRYSHWIWRQYASSVWDDIRMGNVLPFREAKDTDDEKHVHPLQKDVIERCVVLRSNPGEVVLTPFMGVGSEVCGGLALARRAIGMELKSSYYRQAVKNVEHTLEHNSWVESSDQEELFEDEDEAETDEQ